MGKIKELEKEVQEEIARWVGLVKEYGPVEALKMQRQAQKNRKKMEKKLQNEKRR